MAKVIISSSDLSKLFIDSCNKYANISFATAWAGSHNVIEILYTNRDKIRKSTVGLHFYQTSPGFIRKFELVSQIQYDKRFSTDIFHPKVYLFYNDEKDWSAIVGSSNLTGGGFGKNVECNIFMSSEYESSDVYYSLMLLLDRSWKRSEPMGEFFEDYEKMANQSKKSLKYFRIPANPEVSSLDWDTYILRMNDNENPETINTRLNLLDKAQELFSTYSLKDFPDEYSSAVCGLIEEYEGISDWRYFGSMTANGTFRKNVKKYLTGLSNALDKIPLYGHVTEQHYLTFVNDVKNVTGFKAPITICTRLLTMKRPDVFVCVAGRQNINGEPSTMAKLCKLLGVKRKTITLDNYWNYIINSINQSLWYQCPSDIIQKKHKRIYKYRAAMLDALYY